MAVTTTTTRVVTVHDEQDTFVGDVTLGDREAVEVLHPLTGGFVKGWELMWSTGLSTGVQLAPVHGVDVVMVTRPGKGDALFFSPNSAQREVAAVHRSREGRPVAAIGIPPRDRADFVEACHPDFLTNRTDAPAWTTRADTLDELLVELAHRFIV